MNTLHVPLNCTIPEGADNVLVQLSYHLYLLTDWVVTPEGLLVASGLLTVLCVLALLVVALFRGGDESDPSEQGFL